jgi:cytochrome P450
MRHGAVFTLDLAGFEITLVSDLALLDTLLNTPEERLSARAALADAGFDITLGDDSLQRGTEAHHALLTRERRIWASDFSKQLDEAVNTATRAELKASSGQRFDAFSFMCRVSLHASIDVLVDTELTARRPGFISAFMAFQDRLEEATSRALALPRWLSTPMFLKPVERERTRIKRQLADDLAQSAGIRPYTARLRERLASEGASDPQVLADVLIGLLFAAHKNAAVGAAQSLLFLLEHPEQLARVRAGEPGHLERCIKETLRLAAHTIGGIRKVQGEPLVVGDYVLPVGSRVASAHWLVTTDARHFPAPEQFDPDRFASSERRAAAAWIPFSAGVHGCPGQRVGMDMMQAMVKTVLEACPRLELAAKLPPLDFTRATLAQRRGPAWLRN